MKKLFLLSAFCLIHFLGISQPGTLVSINPNSSPTGQSLTTTITGNQTLFYNSSPQGNIQDVYLQLGNYTLYPDMFSVLVADDQHFDAGWTIPSNAPVGQYNLYVNYMDQWWNWYSISLPSAFTVGTTDGYIQGRVFNDVNQNGIQDGGETGASGFSVSFSPNGYSTTTDVNGDYSFPAANGSYTVSYLGNAGNQLVVVPPLQAALPVTINNGNSTGNNFPVTTGLTSFYPDSAYQGQNISVTVYGKGFFSTSGGPNGNINFARFYSGPTTITVPSNKITVIDSSSAVLQFSVPSNATLGLYNFYVYITSGNYAGYHYLNNIFKIVPAPVYMNGTVFFDADSDGVKDPAEMGIINEKLFLSPDSTFAFSDNNGNYSFGTYPGTHTVSWVQQDPAIHLAPNNPSSYTATISTTTGGFNFGLGNTNPNYASKVTFSACWAGCVHPNYLTFKIRNTGQFTYSGIAWFIKDPGMNLYTGGGLWAGTQPDSTHGDTLFFHFTNLAPCAIATISPSFVTPVGGDTVYFSVTALSIDTLGNVAYSSSASGSHIVNCSMDPNEKSVKPAGVLSPHYTLLSDSLVYTILFQNTGTDTAFTVVIRDTIDSNLDLNSIEIINSSHPMLTEIPLVSGVVKFTFNNILLPDSTTNEAKSHGYIIYRIRPKVGTPSNTVVYNKADIYFDFNKPVTTNETFNTLVTTIPGTPAADFTSGNQRFCATGNITFSDATTNSPTSWQWTFPGGTPATSNAQNPTVTYMVKGIYDVTLTATNASGTSTIIKPGFITVDSLPVSQITPSANQTICLGTTFTLNASSNIAPVTYQWQKNNVDIAGATASSYSASQQAAYRVRITNTNNTCHKLSVPVTVFTQRPLAPVSAAGNTAFCSGGNVQLNSSGAGNTFQWLKNNVAISGATSAVYTATSHGNYRVEVTDHLGCSNTSRIIPVTVYQNPNVTVSANGPLTFCAGQNVVLSVSSQANTSYQWTNNGTGIPGATQNQYTATAAGKYRITAINSHLCSNTSSVKQVVVNCRMAAEGSLQTESLIDTRPFDFNVYPNPSAGETHIYFNLQAEDNIDISVYDLLGKKIAAVENGIYSAGSYELTFSTNELTSGVYFVKLTNSSSEQTIKLVINHN